MQRLKNERVLDRRRQSSTASSSQEDNGDNAVIDIYRPTEKPKNDQQSSSLWSLLTLPGIPKPESLGRITTPEELELIAAKRSKGDEDVLLVPRADVDDEEESSSEDSLSSETDLLSRKQQDQEILLVKNRNQKLKVVRFSHRRRKILEEVNVEQYMANREMTVTQERLNALTMIPSPFYCICFLLSGNWVDPEILNNEDPSSIGGMRGFGGFANDMVGDSHGCLDPTTSWFPHAMPALPPLPVIAVAVAIVSHAPFSFLYHWKYAHSLPPGAPRTNHWSRRMDQSMIHVASAFMSFATSGSWDFFVANVLYNAECVYRHWKGRVRPRRNKIRILISVMAYTMPMLRRGDMGLFFQVWLIFLVGFWLFGKYPIGGWSHSAFHLVLALAPPLLMTAACELPSSQEQMKLAAQCMAMLQNGKQ